MYAGGLVFNDVGDVVRAGDGFKPKSREWKLLLRVLVGVTGGHPRLVCNLAQYIRTSYRARAHRPGGVGCGLACALDSTRPCKTSLTTKQWPPRPLCRWSPSQAAPLPARRLPWPPLRWRKAPR